MCFKQLQFCKMLLLLEHFLQFAVKSRKAAIVFNWTLKKNKLFDHCERRALSVHIGLLFSCECSVGFGIDAKFLAEMLHWTSVLISFFVLFRCSERHYDAAKFNCRGMILGLHKSAIYRWFCKCDVSFCLVMMKVLMNFLFFSCSCTVSIWGSQSSSARTH